MILSDLRSYLREHQRVALKDLMIHFDMDADALRGMLQKWINKGNVSKMPATSSCGTSCCRCDETLIEFYEWVEK